MTVTTRATTAPLPASDRRMALPLFTLHECAGYLHTRLSTHPWARPKDGAPLVTVLPSAGRQATVPFVGFAEAFVRARCARPACRCSASVPPSRN